MTTGTSENPAATEVHPASARTATIGTPPRRARLFIPRSRGMVSGVFLVILGLWGAIVPFVGPYFGYEFGSDQTWLMTWNRFWLDVLPGASVLVGGLILIAARNRAVGLAGGWLALVGGVWFVAGPTVAILWDTGAAGPIGAPIGSETVRVLELLGYFYALGAAAVGFAAFALGRLSIVGVGDLEAATAATGLPDERAGDEADVAEPAPVATREPAPATSEPAPAAARTDGVEREEAAATPDRPRGRLFRRS